MRAREEAQLSGAVSKLVMAEDQELPMSERLDLLYTYVATLGVLSGWLAASVKDMIVV